MTQAVHVCPACQHAQSPDATICPNCGLIFGSAPLPGLTTTLDPPPASPERLTSGPANNDPLQPGQRLMDGRYTIQRLLASGGMGTVALAADHSAFDRTVVVKVMQEYFDPARSNDAAEAQGRFIQEARTLAALRHPGIPQIYAFVQDGPRSYMVMEYVEGHTLEQGLTLRNSQGRVLQHGQPFPQAQVLGWGVALCRLLEYLGSREPAPVVHQDIKPANLLLDRNSGEVRLVDFGTAQVMGRQTAAGYGTPGYAPPEQYKGRSEPRSDVYALAATLYHLLTDDDPRDHPFQFPRLASLGAAGSLLKRALNPDVDQRPSAAVLRAGLVRLLDAEEPASLAAPDGSTLSTLDEVARWCETHWHQAANWLLTGLPDLLEQRLGQSDLARDLRVLAERYADDPNEALDQALALLDPQGFGWSPLQLAADPTELDFGVVAIDSAVERRLVIHNTGRRYAHFWLKLPAWLTASGAARTNERLLAPGQQLDMLLSVRGNAREQLGEQRVQIYQGNRLLLEVPVRAEPGNEDVQADAVNLTTAALLTALLFGCVLVWLLVR